MNAKRRKSIGEIVSNLEDLKTEEETALEYLPENFQFGAQGEAMQESINFLDDAISALEEILGN